MVMMVRACVVLAWAISSCSALRSRALTIGRGAALNSDGLWRRRRQAGSPRHALTCRGGASDDDDEEEEPEKGKGAVAEFLGSLPPCTRYHLIGVAFCTAIAAAGVVDPETVLNLDLLKTAQLQFWRPISSALFLGPPSMGMATNVYLLYKYGIELENAVGSPAYAKFLVLQVVLLTVVAGAMGLPQTSASLVAAIIYACSRLSPFDEIRFQFGIKIKYWMLPFGLAVVDCLQQQGAMTALIPPAVGILCGHFHHFFAVVWPRVSGEASAGAPLRPMGKVKIAGRKLGD